MSQAAMSLMHLPWHFHQKKLLHQQNIFSISLSSHLNTSYACINSWRWFPEKKTAVHLDFVQMTIPSPPPPTLDSLYNSFPTSKFKIWRNLTSFIDQKCTYENVTKKLGKTLPHLIWTKSKREHFFLGKPSLGVFTLLSPCFLRHYRENICAKSVLSIIWVE